MLHTRYLQRFGAILIPLAATALYAQAPAAVRQLGTVKAIDGGTITLTTAAGAQVSVAIAPGVPVLQLPAGSTDLKSATSAGMEDIAVGDRILATGKAGDAPGSITASRVILMKSTDIAALHAAEQREWQRGLGGLVKSVDGSEIAVASGTRMLKIETTPATVFKRYAQDSVDFSNAQPGALGEIHPGDQLRARGTVSDDRMSIAAREVITGTFDNLAGVISAVNSAAGTLTLKDLSTKKNVTVTVTAKSDLRNLPADAAARFAARTGAAATGSGAPRAAADANGRPPATAPATTAPRPRSAGADLSQMLSHLPTQSLADLKPGQAVMIVASESSGGNPTAITLLSGVEAILSATPAGSHPVTLSPWNLGEPEGAAGEEGAPRGGGGR